MLLWLLLVCFLGIPVIWRVSDGSGEKVVKGIYCLQLISLRVILKDIVGIPLVPLTLAFFCFFKADGQRSDTISFETRGKNLLTLFSLSNC